MPTTAHTPLDTRLLGRTVPNPYPNGGTWTVSGLRVADDGRIEAEITWRDCNGNLDGAVTLGSLAPGTALWDALAADHARSL